MRFVKGTRGKVAVLGTFAILSLAYLGYLFHEAGVENPFANDESYLLSFESKDVDNLIPVGDVRMAGVTIGRVQDITRSSGGAARVTVNVERDAAPVHRGAIVRVGAKSLAGESYVDIQDGAGEPLPNGATLPPAQVRPAVQLRDVVDGLDPATRKSLGSLIRTAGAGTAGSKQDLSNALTGLGRIGREGYTAVDAIAAQSEDLTALARHTTVVLDALNTGEGQIADLVLHAERLTSATGDQQRNLTETIRKLPGTLDSTRVATGKLRELSTSLAPVAGDLKQASPFLSAALRELPATAQDLRGLLPSFTGTLREAPGTLDRIPAFAQDVIALVPQLRTTMSHLNPMLGYLQPYGPDLGAFFANFGAIMKYTDESGLHFFRLQPDYGTDRGVKGSPLKLPSVLTHNNPYPHPGGSLAPEGRHFTKLRQEPR